MAARTKSDFAAELRTASTWLEGARAVKLLALAEELEGAAPEQAVQRASVAITQPNLQVPSGYTDPEPPADAEASPQG